MFTVAHNAARPFRVYAAGGSITAVGTEFNVLRAAERVVVTVTEGTVEVAPREPPLQDLQVNSVFLSDAARWIPMLVARGQKMIYEKGGKASAVERADLAMVTAWKHGTLVYRDRPLSEVMEDVRRYSSRRITLEEAAANLTFSGTIAEGDVDDWVRGLPRILAVEVIEPDREHFSVRAQQLR
jgi:transmembrane sensor